ncbi:hypothetical protein [Escherichia albertii]|uniref:hypothetical protein n=1 Tax=Escherichia albertii TaxID=208962 RepID=UPI0011E9DE93|nr:hypothetical protein [Escherichia albertii]WDB48620.1 hypothetical protein PS038_04590 [Escherichia albertii]
MRKKIEMNLSKYPLNGVLIKGELADELTEIASIKENSIIEARQRMQEIDECAEKKFVQGYYDGYVKGIIDARGSVVSIIDVFSNALEINRLRIIDELKRILLKSLENVEVFKSVFEQWLEKLPTTDSLVYLYVPSRYKEKFLYTESSCFTRLQKEIRIDYHEDNKFVFFTKQFIAEFCPHNYVDKCELFLSKNNYFSPEKIREISDFALDIIMKDLNSKRMTDNSDVEIFNKVECSEETIMGDNEGGSGY